MNAKYILLILVFSSIAILSSEKRLLLPVYEETRSCTTTSTSDELRQILQYNIKQVKKLEQKINTDAISYTYEDSNNHNKTIDVLMHEWDQKKDILKYHQADVTTIRNEWKKEVCCCFTECPYIDATHEKGYLPCCGIVNWGFLIGGFGGAVSGLMLNTVINMAGNLYPECTNPYDYDKKCESDFFYPNTIPYIITGAVAGFTLGSTLVARAHCLSKQFEEKYPRYHAIQKALRNTKNKIKDMRFNK